MVFSQYSEHPEHKSMSPDGVASGPNTRGLLRRYRVSASAFQLIGKETERGWQQAEDISTLLPALLHYRGKNASIKHDLQERLRHIPLRILERETGLSRHTILRARRGKPIHARSLQLLQNTILATAR